MTARVALILGTGPRYLIALVRRLLVSELGSGESVSLTEILKNYNSIIITIFSVFSIITGLRTSDVLDIQIPKPSPVRLRSASR